MHSAASSFFPDITDPAVRDRIRINWEKEYQEHQVQVGKMQETTLKWAEEIRSHDAARLAMQRERDGWEVERKKWEKVHEEREKILLDERRLELERKKREEERRKEKEDKEKAGIKWAEPQPDPHCLRYGTRKWTAKMDNVPAGQDPVSVCWETKAFIHGRWVLPDNCENKVWSRSSGSGKSLTSLQGAWVGTVGTWYIDFDEAACHTFWTPPRDKVSGFPGDANTR